jgi:hypothetical protein
VSEPAASKPKKAFASCWSLSCVAIIVLTIGAVSAPKLIGSRIMGNEIAAVGGLKTIHSAQLLHREKGNPEFTDLQGLMAADLVDQVLGNGTKQGYVFEARASTAHPTSAWAATASPAAPGKSGDRWFVVNQDGTVYYGIQGPLEVDPATCAIPEGLQPVGR